MTYNPEKQLKIELQANDMGSMCGYTIWRVIGKERKHAISRNADGKDLDWMTDKQLADLEAGKYKFSISAANASEYFGYIY